MDKYSGVEEYEKELKELTMKYYKDNAKLLEKHMSKAHKFFEEKRLEIEKSLKQN